jgi:hypothetical protein
MVIGAALRMRLNEIQDPRKGKAQGAQIEIGIGLHVTPILNCKRIDPPGHVAPIPKCKGIDPPSCVAILGAGLGLDNENNLDACFFYMILRYEYKVLEVF